MTRHRMTAERAGHAENAVLRAEVAALRAQLDAADAHSATLLSTIRSLFARTVESGGTIESIAGHFDARLVVLARFQQDTSGSHDLEMLIRDALREFHFGEDPRIVITGRIAWLQHAQAQPMALALHELVTNALKFGALSRHDGRLHISWVVVAGELWLEWNETGVPVEPSTAAHHGVGRALIEQTLPDTLDAHTRFVLRPGGLQCHITFPLLAQYDVPRHLGANGLTDLSSLQ
ncbi:sensor histidine kinase [Sphingomonas glacialis]|nr:sensor histidine kinase [Sphingomonas glacialis]